MSIGVFSVLRTLMMRIAISTWYVTPFLLLAIWSAECCPSPKAVGGPYDNWGGREGQFLCQAECFLIATGKKMSKTVRQSTGRLVSYTKFLRWMPLLMHCGDKKSTGTSQAAQESRLATKLSFRTAKHQTAKETSVKCFESGTNLKKRVLLKSVRIQRVKKIGSGLARLCQDTRSVS